MFLTPATARVVWAAVLAAMGGLLVGASVSNGTTTSQGLSALVPSSVRNGAVIIFSPGSCSSHAEVLRELSGLDSIPGLNVHGFMTFAPDSAHEMDALRREFRITFELEAADARDYRDIVAANGLGSPVVLLVRQGRLEGVFSGSALDRLAPTLSDVFRGS